jgi:GNAT superfamily N-acetyltransferase
MKILVEKATKEDASVLAELKINIWKDVYKNILPDQYLDNLSKEKKTQKYLKELEEDSFINIFFIKTNPNSIIGTLKIKYYYSFNKKYASIEDLYLIPSYHVKGFGGAVLKFAVDEARSQNCNFLTAWIVENNKIARKLAVKYGFFETNSVRLHVDTGSKLIQYVFGLEK